MPSEEEEKTKKKGGRVFKVAAAGTHQALQEPGRTRDDDEELLDQLDDEGEFGTL